MPINSAPTAYKTSLDYIAEGYWQDFKADQPVAGGIAYEAALRECHLDESLTSLQRVDTLLSQIRRDLVKSGALDENALLKDASYRHLLVFLAFYAGRVLAVHAQTAVHWFDVAELRERAPQLMLAADDFYQRMAATYGADSDASAPLFFVLEPIGMRLFGHIDRPFRAVLGGEVPSSLYQAVHKHLLAYERLDNTSQSPLAADKTPLTAQSPLLSGDKHTVKDDPFDDKVLKTDMAKSDVSQNSVVNTDQYNEKVIAKPSTVTKKTSPATKTVEIKEAANKAVAEKTIDHQPISAPDTQPVKTKNPVNTKNPTITPEIFTKLLAELDEMDVPQSHGQSDYQQAIKVLDQFERHITRQQKPRADIAFSQTHVDARGKALQLLQRSATAGNSAAMLRLAMYELLGEGLEAGERGKEAGIDWVQTAARACDNRAQRLLSRMYYQGAYLPQDMTQGQYWLEQAAANGHEEAAALTRDWQRAEALMLTQKQEQHSVKRYQILIAVIVVAAVLLFVFV